MSKILLCLGLFSLGYLAGTAGNPLQAQSSGYFYGNDGTMGSTHQMLPGGPTYYYDNRGNAGTFIPGAVAPTLPNSYDRSPC